MNNIKKTKIRCQTAYALFRGDLPFGHKVMRDKTKFKRKPKHNKKGIDNAGNS
jgi:hypothetical protein